jgi:hypothetical protein
MYFLFNNNFSIVLSSYSKSISGFLVIIVFIIHLVTIVNFLYFIESNHLNSIKKLFLFQIIILLLINFFLVFDCIFEESYNFGVTPFCSIWFFSVFPKSSHIYIYHFEIVYGIYNVFIQFFISTYILFGYYNIVPKIYKNECSEKENCDDLKLLAISHSVINVLCITYSPDYTLDFFIFWLSVLFFIFFVFFIVSKKKK